jgi:hypothetical protein
VELLTARPGPEIAPAGVGRSDVERGSADCVQRHTDAGAPGGFSRTHGEGTTDG